MFECSFLFYIEGYKSECVRLLLYCMSVMVQHKKISSKVDVFHLEPSVNMQASLIMADGGYMYCDHPKGFSVRPVEISDDPIGKCVYQDHHNLSMFFHHVATLSHTRFPDMHRLFNQLHLEASFQCTFCAYKRHVVSRWVEALQQKYSLLTGFCVESFVHGTLPQETDGVELLDIHASSLQTLFSQIRSPLLRQKIVCILYRVFYCMKENVDEALRLDDDEKLEKAVHAFKRHVVQDLQTTCLFIKTKNIDFQRWLLSLVYFTSLQSVSPSEGLSDPFQMLKKAIVLLSLFFHEKRVLTEDTRFFIETLTKKSEIKVDIERFDRIHPFLRGEYVSVDP